VSRMRKNLMKLQFFYVRVRKLPKVRENKHFSIKIRKINYFMSEHKKLQDITFRHAETLREVDTEMSERGTKTSTL